jgi:electron transfer flavoprotein alpha subunit
VHALLIGAADMGVVAGRYGLAESVLQQCSWRKATVSVYVADVFAATVAEHVKGGYFAMLFAASAQGRDLAPRVAAKLDVPLAPTRRASMSRAASW